MVQPPRLKQYGQLGFDVSQTKMVGGGEEDGLMCHREKSEGATIGIFGRFWPE